MNHNTYTKRILIGNKKRRVIIFIFLFSLLSNRTLAAVSTYFFSQSLPGVFTPLSNSRVIVFTALPNAVADPGLGDNLNFPASIPFPFTFNGISYTVININTNGFITFGPVLPTTSDRSGISNATLWDGSIAALGRDLCANTNSLNLGEISYEVIGSGFNRTFVIQFSKYRRFSLSNVFSERYDFQIRLNEANGIAGNQTIDIIYGQCNSTSLGITSGPQVGLRGASNADFNDRTTTISWLNSFQGLNNTDFMRHTTTVNPPFSLTFTYSPTAPCNFASGGTISPPLGNTCEGNSYTMTAADYSTGSGTSYQWMVSNVPFGPYSNVIGGTGANTTTYVTDPLTPGVYYYVMQTTCSNCGPCSAFSSELTLLVFASNILPPIISGSTVICPGGSTILDAGPGFEAYSWSDGSGLVGSSQLYVADATGPYTVTVSNLSGCTASSTANVTQSNISPPTITGSTIICPGGSTILDAGPGYNSYSWSDGSGIVGSSQIFVADAIGPYTATVSNGAGCTASSSVIVNEVPTCGVTLNMNILIEGYYLGNGTMIPCLFVDNVPGATPNDVDTLTIHLMNPISPYNEIDQQKGILHIHGDISVTFNPVIVAGNSYWIVVTHRNTVQIWSSAPVLMNTVTTFDFTH